MTAKLRFAVVELWPDGYANARGPDEIDAALARLEDAIPIAIGCGLEVHGGHGLTYRNVGPVASLRGFTEFNIGHSIISRAVFVGLRQAVREMNELLLRHGPKE